MRSRAATALTVLGIAIIAAGCGSSTPRAQSRPTSPSPATTTHPPTKLPVTSRSAATTTSAAPATSSSTTSPPPRTTTPATSAPPSTTPPTTASTPPTSLVDRLRGIGPAQQVIAVAASDYGTGTATLTAYQRGATGWQQVFGPWPAYIGRNGVAPTGAKREGDGRTPSGVFGFDFMFGVNPNPGVKFPFRHITGSNFMWDDDPSSANYNEWVDSNTAPAGARPEPMDSTPSYLYGVVIAYNDARTPGLGSAIFLHVSHGSSTAGCISLPVDQLLEVLRWLDPARSPRIAIGTLASLTA